MGIPSSSSYCPRPLQPGLEYLQKWAPAALRAAYARASSLQGEEFLPTSFPLVLPLQNPVQEPFPALLSPLQAPKGRYKPSRSLPGRLDWMTSEAFSNLGDSIVLSRHNNPQLLLPAGLSGPAAQQRGLAACESPEAALGPPPASYRTCSRGWRPSAALGRRARPVSRTAPLRSPPPWPPARRKGAGASMVPPAPGRGERRKGSTSGAC